MLPNNLKPLIANKETILDAFNLAYHPVLEYDITPDDLTIEGEYDPEFIEDIEYHLSITADTGYGIYVGYREVDGTIHDSHLVEGTTVLGPEKRINKLVIFAYAVEDAEDVKLEITYTPEHITGIFSAIEQAHGPEYDLNFLDMDYILNHAMNKKLSPIVRAMLMKSGTDAGDHLALSVSQIKKLADLVYRRFGPGWDHIYDALTAEYNPIHNYDRDETITYDTEDGHGASDDYADTDTEKRSTDITSEVEDATTENDVYGFNSSTAVPDSKSTVNSSQHTTGLADDNVIERTHTLDGKLLDTKEGTVRTQTKGNIGVTTNMEMVSQEVQLRVANQMRQILMRDLDSFITTPTYGDPVSSNIIREEI